MKSLGIYQNEPMVNLRRQFTPFGQTSMAHVMYSKDKAVNFGDGDGTQVPCTLFFKVSSNFIDILQRQLTVDK